MNPSGIEANEPVAHRSSGLPLKNLQRYALAVLSVGIALGASLLLEHFHFRVPSALLLLFAVAISSWYGGPGPAVLTVILSIISFYWYFVEPVRTIYIYRSEIPFFIIFAAFAALLSWFGTIRRRAEAGLHKQAALLNLTHDTIFVMDMEGVIKYWNRGAEERYGWNAEQAVGKVVHDLLKTVFLSTFEEIKAEAACTGRWEGELLHTKKDGTQVVVASRWSLQRDGRGKPVAILETNNDITERKRAEETLSRLNRELRAISNCNQVLLRATDEQSLIDQICRIVCEEAGFRMAWVGYAQDDNVKSIRPVAWSGVEDGYLAAAEISWSEESVRGRGPGGMAIRTGRTSCSQDFATDANFTWREAALQRGYRSAISLPLKDENAKTFGILTIYSTEPNAFTSEEIRLLEELAADLAFGIVTLRSRAARKQAEQALRQSEAYLADAQRLSHTGSWALDVASYEYHYWSEEMFRIYGFDPQEGLPPVDAVRRRIHPEDRERRKASLEKSLHEKVDTFEEFRIMLPDGAVKHVYATRHPVLDEAGNVVQLIGTAIDITERKRAEEALRRSEAYLKEAQRLSHTGSWAWDVTTGTYIYWSEEIFTIFGFDPQKGVGTLEEISRRIRPEDLNRWKESFERSLREKVDTSDECKFVMPDGTLKHIHLIRHPVLNDAGDVVQLVGTSMDITDRKRAEESLRRSEAFLAEAQRVSHTGSWALDPSNLRYIYNSEESYRIWGFDPSAGPPNMEAVFQRIHPDDRDRWKTSLEKSLREKADSFDEYRIVMPDGTIKHIHTIRHAVLNEAGDLERFVGTTVDITERTRTEEALRRSEAYLAEAQRLSHTGSFAYKPGGAVLYCSEEIFRIWGFDRQQAMAHEMVRQRIHPQDRGRVRARAEASVAGKTDWDDEFRIVLPDGAVKHLQAFHHPVFAASGELTEVFGTHIDITERKRAEESLRRSEAYLAETQRLTHIGTWADDPTTKPLYWSEEEFRIWGLDPRGG
ncbi:MAG TPA: PAS domain-containing protein, partial [Terriglobales bacterium]|nr:PAS domain-containing protein [Terriglobales bacterium]